MFRKLSIILTGIFLSCAYLSAQKACVFAGSVLDNSTGKPVEFATVMLEGTEQWAVADLQGRFSISNVPSGKTVVTIACLGYATWSKEIIISKDITNFKISLKPDNLALEGAVVTAKEDGNSATTSRTIDKTALDHVQLMNLADISSLLPGGATGLGSQALTNEQQIFLRGEKSESGSVAFGTAIEVDGVRLSSNASFTNSSLNGRTGSVSGSTTNSIASSNIESVEVISGVPSVEYGDMSSGVVIINTKKGKTPWSISMSTTPNTKQVSLSKGFALGLSKNGRAKGVLNSSLEHTVSISEPMSPYTSYDRNALSLSYSNLFSHGALADTPIRFSATLSGNVGGLDDQNDPDRYTGTFHTKKDDFIRAAFSANWLLSKSWITNLEINGSASYGNKQDTEKAFFNNTTTDTALHSTGQGYFISAPYDAESSNLAVLRPHSLIYNTMYFDDRPFSSKLSAKANWARNSSRFNNKLKLGADWSTDKNYGTGASTDDLSTAPTFREWRFCDVPTMHNIGAYIEDNLSLHFGKDSRLNLIAGLRNDVTAINGSAYGVTSSFSPRFNAKWTVFTSKTHKKRFVKELSFRASWGVAVKQPSFAVLYPTPEYQDLDVFKSLVDSKNVEYRAYYVIPKHIEYNSALRWQKNHQGEFGIETMLGGTRISLAAFHTTTIDAYNRGTRYEVFQYNKTATPSKDALGFPVEDCIYSISPDGVITVSDKSGQHGPVALPNKGVKRFVPGYYEKNNETPIRRYGLEWVIDFKRIKAINTTIRWDGSFYSYKSVYTDMVPFFPTNKTDGEFYKCVGWYVGGHDNSNGQVNRNIRTNVTLTTHIPKVRMIVSAKVEGCLMRYSRYLSENADGSRRSYVLTDKTDFSSITDASIYEGKCFTVTYPEYYTTQDDPTPRPFKEAYLAAKRDGDTELYNYLTALVVDNTTYDYTFQRDWMSPYFSANISVTKEIGDLASISFYANNFFNNLGQVRSSKTGKRESVSSYIPRFYYGLTLRIKL